VVVGESNGKKKDINGGKGDNIGESRNGGTKRKIRGNIDEKINKGLLFKGNFFFKAFTTPTAFAASTKRNFTDKSY